MKIIKDKFQSLNDIFNDAKSDLNTEEATKTALVLPMLQALGYNVFNPREVKPEYTADVGLKSGEKVDYAILKNGTPEIIIECKHWKENLDKHTSQLFRYFGTLDVNFAILTNGIEYRVYTDLVKANVMDNEPFMIFNISNSNEGSIAMASELHKAIFDNSKLVEKAKLYKNEFMVKEVMLREWENPSESLTKIIVKNLAESPVRFTDKTLATFKPIIKKIFNKMVSDKVEARLGTALTGLKHVDDSKVTTVEVSKIVTTEEEIEGFNIVKAMARRNINSARITQKDTQSYFGILVDNNVRKPICRLHFNSSNKYLGLLDSENVETRHKLETLDDLYKFEKEILERATNLT